MRWNIKTISLLSILIILIAALFILLYFETGVAQKYIYLLGAGIITFIGFLLSRFILRKKPTKSQKTLELPNSKLNENPRLAFNESLQILMSQLKTVQPLYKHAIYIIDPDSSSFAIQDTEIEYFAKSVDLQNKILQKINSVEQTLLVKHNEVPDDWDGILTEMEKIDTNCMLGARIMYNKIPIGAIIAYVEDMRRIESNDQILIKQFADQISLSISVIDKIESLQKHHNVIDRINSLYDSVNISENKNIIYEQIVKLCQSIFKYDKLTIMLSYQEVDSARIEYVDGYSLDISRDEVFPLKNSIFANAIQKNQVIRSKDIKNDFGKRHRFFADEMTKRSITSVLAIPLTINKNTIGCIAIERFEKQEYSEMQQLYLEKIAQSINVLLHWQLEFHKMYLNTTHDNLTGLLNYHEFLNRLDIEMNRTMRNEQSLVIMVVDVDKFKRINDTFGHPIGNVALKEIATLLTSCIRNIDIIARYGGEEFIIAINNSNINDAKQIAERIVSNVANNIFIIKDQRIKVTVSVGMAEYPVDSDQVQKLIEAADQAMYNAKNQGGNSFSV